MENKFYNIFSRYFLEKLEEAFSQPDLNEGSIEKVINKIEEILGVKVSTGYFSTTQLTSDLIDNEMNKFERNKIHQFINEKLTPLIYEMLRQIYDCKNTESQFWEIFSHVALILFAVSDYKDFVLKDEDEEQNTESKTIYHIEENDLISLFSNVEEESKEIKMLNKMFLKATLEIESKYLKKEEKIDFEEDCILNCNCFNKKIYIRFNKSFSKLKTKIEEDISNLYKKENFVITKDDNFRTTL